MSVFPCVPLREIADINPRYVNGAGSLDEPVSFVPMDAVSEVTGMIVAEQERPLGEVLKGFTPFQSGDVLVAKITPCFENGKIALAQVKHRYAFGSTEFQVVRADEQRLNPRYLLHFLRQPKIRAEGAKRMTGSAGQRRVPRHYLEALAVPLPPLAEQQRIVAILDKIDTLRSKRRETISKMENLCSRSSWKSLVILLLIQNYGSGKNLGNSATLIGASPNIGREMHPNSMVDLTIYSNR